MRKVIKLIFILAILTLVFSSIALTPASADSDIVSTFPQLYIGEYEQEDFAYSGVAHVIFATVSDPSVECGVLIERTVDGVTKTYKFIARTVANTGKFGIAIYDLPEEGSYKAMAYTGAGDNRTIGEKVVFSPNKPTYTLNFDVSATSGVTAPATQVVAQGTNAEVPNVTVPSSAPANSQVGWFTADGKAWDFDTIVTEDMTLSSKWVASDALNNSTWELTNEGALGNAVGVDLSDGSTLFMEFDVISSTISSANYNYYLWTRNDTSWGTWSNYHAPYGNYAYYSPWSTKWTAAGVTDTSATGAVKSDGNNILTMLAPNQRVRVSYTAPTASTTGSYYWEVKAANATEYTTLWSVTGLTLDHVRDTSNVFMGFQMAKASNVLIFNNFRMYVNEDGYNLPAFSNKAGALNVWVPSYTVSYDVSQVSKTAVEAQTVKEGYNATAPVVTPVATPVNAVLGWFDEDGNKFDFTTSIEEDITLTARWIADETMYNKVYDIVSLGSSAFFGSSTRTDLTGGKTLSMEFDILSSKISSSNYNMSYWLKYYTNTADVNTATTKELSSVSGQHTSQMYGNYAYYSPWQTKFTANGLKTSGLTQGEGSNPVSYYAAGQTFKWVYKAPITQADGKGATGYMKMYVKPIGADDSAYTCVGSIEGLVSTGSTSTSHVHPNSVTDAVMATDLRNMTSNKMVVTKVRIFGDDGVSLPWHWDTTTCNFVDVTADWGADTSDKTYAIGYTEGTTSARGWFGSVAGVDLVGDETLTMEFKVLQAGNKWQNTHAGFAVVDVDPTSVTTNPLEWSANDRISIDGNWAFNTSSYEGRTAVKRGGGDGSYIGGTGIWDPYTDIAAGDWVKVVYKPYVSDTNKGYLRVYTRAGDSGEYTFNVSVEDISTVMNNGVRLLWYTYDGTGSSGTNFTHTITNYRVYCSNPNKVVYKAAGFGGNHAVTVTTAE